MSRIEHRVTYDPNGSRCSCGWVARREDEIHLISPHAVAMIADQRARIAELEAERVAFVALARAAWQVREDRRRAWEQGEIYGMQFTSEQDLHLALEHPAVRRALKETP